MEHHLEKYGKKLTMQEIKVTVKSYEPTQEEEWISLYGGRLVGSWYHLDINRGENLVDLFTDPNRRMTVVGHTTYSFDDETTAAAFLMVFGE